jgi:hypothetical protein
MLDVGCSMLDIRCSMFDVLRPAQKNSKAAVSHCLALSDHHMSFTADDDPNRGHHASDHPDHGASSRGCNTGDTDRAGNTAG